MSKISVAVVSFLSLGIASAVLAGDTVEEEWVATYKGPGNSGNYPVAGAVDGNGNVFVAGRTWVGSDSNFATVKYSPSGEQLWARIYDNGATEMPTDLAVDPAGNVVVTGQSDPGTDYATVKYSADGDQLWVRRYNGTANSLDQPQAVATDAAGNVYVTGHTHGQRADGRFTSYDIYTIKYDADGNELWADRYDGVGTWADLARDITVDADGNVYVVGLTVVARKMDGSDDRAAVTIKYDANGNRRWVATYNGTAVYPYLDEGNEVAVDAEGNVHVVARSAAPYVAGSRISYDYVTIKYDAAGNQQWLRRFKGSDYYGSDSPDIVVDTAGNSYVALIGAETPDASFRYDFTTVKYDADGNQLWARALTPGSRDVPYDLALDSRDNVYALAKTFFGVSIMKYDPSGTAVWFQKYNGGATGRFGALSIDAADNVIASASGPWSSIVTLKYSQQMSNALPTAQAGPDQQVMIGETVTLDGSLSTDDDGTITSYVWDFGDGSHDDSSGSIATHVWTTPGAYTATLTVTDDGGDIAADTATVTVLGPAEALDELIGLVEDLDLLIGLDKSLDAKLASARDALTAHNSGARNDALNKLAAFINSVEAQRDNHLTSLETDALIEYANRIVTAMSL